MKNLATILAVAIISTFTVSASETTTIGVEHNNAYGYGNSYIFVENGITFSVYPDGEFDFYIDNQKYFGANVDLGNVNISYNSGYRYDAYVQYDDYGAVIQIENTPIYYDFNGRVSTIGSVNIFYNRGRLARVGGLYVHYNNYGVFSHCTGYINVYNRGYIHRPYYRYFTRPAVNLCIVNYRPYRRYYTPVRYTYYRPYRNNYRKSYATIGRDYHYRNDNPRTYIYRNDKRVATRRDTPRNTQTRNSSSHVNRNNVANNRSNVSTQRSSTVKRTTTVRTPQRSAQSNAPKVVQRTTTVKTPQRTVERKSTTVVKRAPATTQRKATSTSRSTQRVATRAPQSTRNSSATRIANTSVRRR